MVMAFGPFSPFPTFYALSFVLKDGGGMIHFNIDLPTPTKVSTWDAILNLFSDSDIGNISSILDFRTHDYFVPSSINVLTGPIG
jgi:hypothetical protein